jgi:hypothetical protein
MPVSEVVEVARWAFTNKMGTLMLQGGELHGEKRMRYLEEMAREVGVCGGRMCVAGCTADLQTCCWCAGWKPAVPPVADDCWRVHSLTPGIGLWLCSECIRLCTWQHTPCQCIPLPLWPLRVPCRLPPLTGAHGHGRSGPGGARSAPRQRQP